MEKLCSRLHKYPSFCTLSSCIPASFGRAKRSSNSVCEISSISLGTISWIVYRSSLLPILFPFIPIRWIDFYSSHLYWKPLFPVPNNLSLFLLFEIKSPSLGFQLFLVRRWSLGLANGHLLCNTIVDNGIDCYWFMQYAHSNKINGGVVCEGGSFL